MKVAAALIIVVFLGSCATYTESDFSRDVHRRSYPQEVPIWAGLVPGLPQALQGDPIGILYFAGFVAPLFFQVAYMESNVDSSLTGEAYDEHYDLVFEDFYRSYWPYLIGNYAIWSTSSIVTANYTNRVKYESYLDFAESAYGVLPSEGVAGRNTAMRSIRMEIQRDHVQVTILSDRQKKLASLQDRFTSREAQAIINEEIFIGMSESALFESWGRPDTTNTTTTAFGRSHQHIYRGRNKTAYVYVEDGVVTTIQN